MFGINTKKDKKIEALQREIDRVKSIIYENVNVNTLYSEFVVPIEPLTNMSEKRIKRILASKMVDLIDENLEIEHTTDNYKGLEIYKAKLKVIKM